MILDDQLYALKLPLPSHAHEMTLLIAFDLAFFRTCSCLIVDASCWISSSVLTFWFTFDPRLCPRGLYSHLSFEFQVQAFISMIDVASSFELGYLLCLLTFGSFVGPLVNHLSVCLLWLTCCTYWDCLTVVNCLVVWT